MEEEKKVSEQPNSTEISINAKGQYSGKVKCYGETPGQAYDNAVEYSDKLNSIIKEKNKE
tara:strand:- start:966 stop:1145 length:180 start_codon:yes stop_codon:yes gene_type:complete